MSDERYEIRGKIGQGGVGAVYRAFDRNLNREVAIKRVLSEGGFDANDSEDEATKALLKEATALCSVQHPHIVTVYDAGVDEDGPYVVMELLSGRTLDEMVERGTMTWVDFRETAIQCLEALIAAQELNLVHRDIKPSNVMVTWLPSGKFQVKLVDFGLAKFSAAPSLQTIDHGDAVFGSIHFMAPEQFERIPLDKRTDMYSLGCVFFYCLAGHYPFDGETAPLVMASHLNNNYTPLNEYRPDLPDWVCQWVEWHLGRLPDDRPMDAREALERFLSFEAPVNPATAPVGVRAVPASQLLQGSGEPGANAQRVTGPVPEFSSMTSPVTAQAKTLITGGTESAPLSSETDTGSIQAVVPKAITPPDGAKPSVHTGAQIIRATTGPVAAHATSPATAGINSSATQALPPGISPSQPQMAAPSEALGAGTLTTPLAGPAATNAMVNIPKKGLGTGAKAAIGSVLGIAILFGGWVLVDKIKNNSAAKELEELLQKAAKPTATTVRMNEDQVKRFLTITGSTAYDKDKMAVYQALYLAKSTDGTNIDELISKHAVQDSINEEVRVKLFDVLGKRGSEDGVSDLMEYAKESKEERSVVAALNAASGNLGELDMEALYQLISFSDSAAIQVAAEKAVKQYASTLRNKEGLKRELKRAHEAASDTGAKQAYLRLLGAVGGEKEMDTLKEALSSSDENTKIAAYTAFGNWSDDSLFEDHLKSMASEEAGFSRKHAFSTVLKFLNSKPDVSEQREEEMWKLLHAEIKDDEEKKEFISKIARHPADWSVELVESFTKASESEDVSFLAERALESINRKLGK